MRGCATTTWMGALRYGTWPNRTQQHCRTEPYEGRTDEATLEALGNVLWRQAMAAASYSRGRTRLEQSTLALVTRDVSVYRNMQISQSVQPIGWLVTSLSSCIHDSTTSESIWLPPPRATLSGITDGYSFHCGFHPNRQLIFEFTTCIFRGQSCRSRVSVSSRYCSHFVQYHSHHSSHFVQYHLFTGRGRVSQYRIHILSLQ